MTKKILGLDLGTTSIGWAYIQEATEQEASKSSILGMGVRIIPLNETERDEFNQGNAISKHQKRTLKRSLRKGQDRYQLRRTHLRILLTKLEMLPDASYFSLNAEELYGLRAKAVHEKISLQELGRVLLHLNQKRGYKSTREELASDDKKQSDYLKTISDRSSELKAEGKTVGEKLYELILEKTDGVGQHIRLKERVYPRQDYINEFDRIWSKQQEYYPEVLNAVNYEEIRNRIIYYQRPLKSKKGLVSVCDFEKKEYVREDGQRVERGPKVAPRSSPLFQVCKIWESINNITYTNKQGQKLEPNDNQKLEIFQLLDREKNVSSKELEKIIGLKKQDGWWPNELIRKKGIQGNVTKAQIREALKEAGISADAIEKQITFHLETKEQTIDNLVDTTSGEVFSKTVYVITDSFEQQPLYQLWHVLYSIADQDALRKTLDEKFGLKDEAANLLIKLDFTKGGFGNKSSKAIRKILPYLQSGLKYSEACAEAGYNHSDSITLEENNKRQLDEVLKLFPKNSLRQPVVEKILNQLTHLVNAIIQSPEYGRPDEIRVELARELKQSKDERNDTYSNISKRERENDKIRKELAGSKEFPNRPVSKRDIERYRLWLEFDGVSPYEPNKIISLSELYSGLYDIEHIIPRSRLFDDSFANKTICPRKYNSGNAAKNQQTGYDYMKGRESDFQQYLECIENAFKNKKISKTKRDRLLTTAEDIPKDFIDRQLRQTQYITKTAAHHLRKICRNVTLTSGGVTDYLRHHWGWDTILEQLQLPKYREAGQTEIKIIYHSDGKEEQKEVIKDWSKRDDHRHHAIDALTVACTNQSIIKRINDLNQVVIAKEQESKQAALKAYDDEALKNVILKFKKFETQEVIEHVQRILISFKQGKKVASNAKRFVTKHGKRKAVQSVLVPRGPLHEESVYGCIEIPTRYKLNKRFELAHLISNNTHKKLVLERLKQHDFNVEKAFLEPIWLDKNKTKPLTHVELNRYQYVMSYELSGNFKAEDVKWIVDKGVRDAVKKHLEEHGNDPKKAFGDLKNNPVWMNKAKGIPIKRVRLFTALEAVEPVWFATKENQQREAIGFVKPGNNHHIALYRDAENNVQEHVVTYWHAVQRKMNGLPVVIKDPSSVWEKVTNSSLFEDKQAFLEKLPPHDWKYETSLQANEMFVFGIDKENLEKLISDSNYASIAPNIFRARKLAIGQYHFNNQYETKPRESIIDKKVGRCIQTSKSNVGIKINISVLGNISLHK